MTDIHDATPLQLKELVKRRERLARIASRAFKEPEIMEEPDIVEEPRSEHWFRIVDAGPAAVTIRDIQIAVAHECDISFIEMMSDRRLAKLVQARQIAMYLARSLTTISTPAIGRRFGGRDHTTVLHSIRQIERLILSDPILAARIEAIRNTLEIQ